MRPGDILVCPYTDPAWTPLLRIAAGVVTDTGGVLSHAAIVARELVRAGAAVALMPPLTLPADDPALAIRDVAETRLMRRLVAAVRDTPPAPALTALLTAVRDQERRIARPARRRRS